MRSLVLEGLPPLRENPFNGRPLERNEFRLLGGRDNQITFLTSLIRHRSPRMILLKGERGSGRTSMIHALASQTELHRSFTMFPHEEHAMRLLNETFSMLVGFDRPPHVTSMVEHMVEAVSSYHGPLQLISYDFPNASGPLLCSSIQRLTGALRRLKALVLVTVTPEQFQAFPDDLVNEFDSVVELEPVCEEGIKEIVERRIATVSRKEWNCDDDTVEVLHDETQGHLGRLIRRMRDLVDEARAQPEQSSSHSGWQRIRNSGGAHSTLTQEEKTFVEPAVVEKQVEVQTTEVEEKPADPWDLDTEEEVGVQSEEEFIQPMPIFSLEDDLEEVDSMLTDSDMGPPISAGMFGSLARRNRDSMIGSPRFTPSQDVPDVDEYEEEPTMRDGATDLWVHEGAPLIENNLESEQAATLGLQMPQPSLQPEVTEPWVPPSPVVQPPSMPPQQNIVSQNTGLAERLAGFAPRPQRWDEQSMPLDIERMRNLAEHERVIVEIAAQREFSPSDEYLGNRLAIKRPRMSQLANGLYRSGILSVRKHGRSRWFSLTNDARAQLVAWGLLEESI
jgi:hypothetical protein